MKRKKLTPKERAFCMFYVKCMDAKEAAQKSGYKNPAKKGADLLCREDILSEILRLCEVNKKLSVDFARSGYERLAFGSISDAVSLLYTENPEKEQLDRMDLFCVSEIKTKDGYMEIKFFDRLKALEKLSENTEAKKEDGGISPLYSAILQGAAALNSQEKGDKDET